MTTLNALKPKFRSKTHMKSSETHLFETFEWFFLKFWHNFTCSVLLQATRKLILHTYNRSRQFDSLHHTYRLQLSLRTRLQTNARPTWTQFFSQFFYFFWWIGRRAHVVTSRRWTAEVRCCPRYGIIRLHGATTLPPKAVRTPAWHVGEGIS